MKQSLDKQDKLRLKSEFTYVREHGQKLVGDCLLLVWVPTTEGTLRCGVICGKKFSNKAVIRNRARRLLWETVRLLKRQITPCTFVLIPRQRINALKQQQVQQALLRLLKQANLSSAASLNPSQLAS